MFLDVKICRKNGKFVISVYRKPTFRGVFTNYESFIATYHKRGFFHTLLHRSFSFNEVLAFSFNNYPPNFTGSCIKSFLNKLYMTKVMVQNVPIEEMLLLSCRSWEVLHFKFQRSFKNYLAINCNLRIVCMSPVCMSHESKAFSPLRISYLRCYFQDLLTSVLAVMLPIKERPNAILKSESVNI